MLAILHSATELVAAWLVGLRRAALLVSRINVMWPRCTTMKVRTRWAVGNAAPGGAASPLNPIAVF